MTTRNQKRSNETTPANTSENKTVLAMLTNANANGDKTRNEEITLTDPAIAKDVRCVRTENHQSTDPATAKDRGELLEIDNRNQAASLY